MNKCIICNKQIAEKDTCYTEVTHRHLCKKCDKDYYEMAMKSSVVFNTRTENSKDNWETPPELYSILYRFFGFNLDVAADSKNTKCPNYLKDALTDSWRVPGRTTSRIWCNPPFSIKERFLMRALEFRQHTEYIVFILPNNSRETKWWNTLVVPFADQVINLIGRVNFIDRQHPDKKQCNFPTCLVVYRPRLLTIEYGVPQELYWDWKNE